MMDLEEYDLNDDLINFSDYPYHTIISFSTTDSIKRYIATRNWLRQDSRKWGHKYVEWESTTIRQIPSLGQPLRAIFFFKCPDKALLFKLSVDQ